MTDNKIPIRLILLLNAAIVAGYVIGYAAIRVIENCIWRQK